MHRSSRSSARSLLLAQRASGMRFAPSSAEAALWRCLRGRRLGAQFRRQVMLGGRYIADFVAPGVKLVVEVDGPHHAGQATTDERRTRVFERLGYRVFSVDAELVHRDLGAAVALVKGAVTAG